MRGVIIAALCGVFLCGAKEPDKRTDEILDELFHDIDSSDEPVPFHRYRFLDLEHFLEESPELEEAYYKLTPKQKQELIDLVDELNALLSEALKMSELPKE